MCLAKKVCFACPLRCTFATERADRGLPPVDKMITGNRLSQGCLSTCLHQSAGQPLMPGPGSGPGLPLKQVPEEESRRRRFYLLPEESRRLKIHLRVYRLRRGHDRNFRFG